MKRSIFISRHLPETSELLAFLQQENWEIYHKSLIEIQPLKFKIESEFDWIFISSSNGARILFEAYSPSENVKIGAVGEATANAVRQFGFEPDFIGATGNMDQLGDEFAKRIGAATVLFAGAENGSRKIQSKISASQVEFIPVYRSIQKSNLIIPETEFVLLTSPSNVDAYLNFASLKEKKVIAIGNTTAEYLASCGISNVLIPETPQEKEVVEILRGL